MSEQTPPSPDETPLDNPSELRRRLIASGGSTGSSPGEPKRSSISSFQRRSGDTSRLTTPSRRPHTPVPEEGDTDDGEDPSRGVDQFRRMRRHAAQRMSEEELLENDITVPIESIVEAQPDPQLEASVRKLKKENKELRQLLQEVKQLLVEASEQEKTFLANEQMLQEQLQQKEEDFDGIQTELAEIKAKIESGELGSPPPPPKTRGELEEWADELEKESFKLGQERRQFEDERLQLREDETALESQMREMELQMARERAAMARQETELKRLSSEIQHQLEMMQKGDPALRDMISKFRQHHQEIMSRGAGGMHSSQPSGPPMGGPPPGGPPPGGPPPTPNRGSGFFRRLTGGDGS